MWDPDHHPHPPPEGKPSGFPNISEVRRLPLQKKCAGENPGTFLHNKLSKLTKLYLFRAVTVIVQFLVVPLAAVSTKE